MIDVIKKAMLTGVGLASISLDKAEEIAKELMEQGNLTEQEGKKLVSEMMGYAEKSKQQMEKQVRSYVEKAMGKMDVAKKSEVDDLKKTIAELQSKLDELQKD